MTRVVPTASPFSLVEAEAVQTIASTISPVVTTAA